MLDAGTYQSIERDPGFTTHAVVTVLLSSLAAGIGAAGWFGLHASTLMLVSGTPPGDINSLGHVDVSRLAPGCCPGRGPRLTLGELLRTTGVAAAPGLLLVIATMPGMTLPVFVGAIGWMFAAMVIAVRHALDFDGSGRALAVLCHCDRPVGGHGSGDRPVVWADAFLNGEPGCHSQPTAHSAPDVAVELHGSSHGLTAVGIYLCQVRSYWRRLGGRTPSGASARPSRDRFHSARRSHVNATCAALRSREVTVMRRLDILR